MHTARNGNLKLLLSLIMHGAELEMCTDLGWTALHVAAYFRQPMCISALVHFGAQVNIKDKDGYTPLFTSVALGYTEVVHQLLVAKADTRITSAKVITLNDIF